MQWLYELSGLAFAFMDIETVRYGMMEFVSVVLVYHDHSRKIDSSIWPDYMLTM